MRLSKNFTLKEFTRSMTATRLGIDNTPKDEHLEKCESIVRKRSTTNQRTFWYYSY